MRAFLISKVVTLAEAGAALAAWSENPGGYTKILVGLSGEKI